MTELFVVDVFRLMARGGGATFPAAGTVVEEAGANPAFILDMLIGYVIDASEILSPKDLRTLMAAVITSRTCKSAPAFKSLEDRPQGIDELAYELMRIYNLKAKDVHHAPIARLYSETDQQAGNLSFEFIYRKDKKK